MSDSRIMVQPSKVNKKYGSQCQAYGDSQGSGCQARRDAGDGVVLAHD